MFIIIVLAAVSGLIATDLYAPSLPAIALFFHQSINHTELTMSLFLVGFAFSQLFYGPISDYAGRKPLLILGTILFMLGSLLCVVTTSFSLFCVSRILQGLAAGAGLSLARVVMRDCYNGVLLAVKTSQMAIFIALTPAVAPLIGGVLQDFFGFRIVFAVLFAYGLLLFLLLCFGFRESIQHREANLSVTHIVKSYRNLLSNFHFMHYVLIAGLAFSAIILYANVMPFIVQVQLHFSAAINGVVLLLGALGVTVGAFTVSRVVKRISPRVPMQIGLILFSASGLLLILSNLIFGLHIFILAPLIFLVTLGCGLIFPTAVALAFSQIEVNIGIAGAIYGFTQIFTTMLINFCLNGISEQGQTLLGIFYLILGLIGLGLLRVPVKDTFGMALENR